MNELIKPVAALLNALSPYYEMSDSIAVYDLNYKRKEYIQDYIQDFNAKERRQLKHFLNDNGKFCLSRYFPDVGKNHIRAPID